MVLPPVETITVKGARRRDAIDVGVTENVKVRPPSLELRVIAWESEATTVKSEEKPNVVPASP